MYRDGHSFVVRPLGRFPGVVVWNPQGQRADRLQDFVEFWAAQGHPLRRLRHTTRILADAATWLDIWQQSWATMELSDWGDYLQRECRGDILTDAKRLIPAVEALHQFYAFWHWQDPAFIPWQLWPQCRGNRYQWLLHELTRHGVDKDVWLPNPLPF